MVRRPSPRPGFPPIVYFAPTEHAELELRASAAGALRVLPRTDFEHAQLAEALREIAGAAAQRAGRDLVARHASRRPRTGSARCGSAASAACGASPSVARRACSWREELPHRRAARAQDLPAGAGRRRGQRPPSIASCANTNWSRTSIIPTSRASTTSGWPTIIYFSRWSFSRAATCRPRMGEPLVARAALGYLRQMAGGARRTARGRRAAPGRQARQRAAARGWQRGFHRFRPCAPAGARERHHGVPARSSARRTT